jgi:hypothetical protein
MFTVKQWSLISLFSLLLTSYTNAQNIFSSMDFGFCVGVAMPTGEFSKPSLNNLEIGNTGVGANLYAINNLPKSFQWITSLDFNLNSVKMEPRAERLGTASFSCGDYITANIASGPCLKLASAGIISVRVYA